MLYKYNKCCINIILHQKKGLKFVLKIEKGTSDFPDVISLMRTDAEAANHTQLSLAREAARALSVRSLGAHCFCPPEFHDRCGSRAVPPNDGALRFRSIRNNKYKNVAACLLLDCAAVRAALASNVPSPPALGQQHVFVTSESFRVGLVWFGGNSIGAGREGVIGWPWSPMISAW